MIIFFENGQLGNQIFQYKGLRHLFPDQKIVFIGAENLFIAIPSVQALCIPKSRLGGSKTFYLLRKIFQALAKIHLIGRIEENLHTAVTRKNRGLLWNVFFAHDIFCQHKQIAQLPTNDISIRDDIIQQAKHWLATHQCLGIEKNLVFMHIRRGDYLLWPNKEAPAVLDLRWYTNAMRLVREKLDKPQFIIVTDDFYYANDFFGKQTDVLISRNNLFVDLALMSLCHHGILSPSSFAFCGAKFSYHNNLKQNNSIYYAPKYWAGHRLKEWYPNSMQFDWLQYLE